MKEKHVSSIESRTLRSTVYGVLQLALTFISTILLVPLLISNWGAEKYGLYLNIFAFIQLLKTLDLGHQVFVGNEFNRDYHSDKDKARTILNSSIKMAFVLGFIEVLVFIGLWSSGKIDSLLGFPGEESNPILFGILCMVIMWWLVGSVSGILVKVVLSKGLYPETLLWGIVFKILEVMLLVIAGISGMSLFHFLWMWALINIIFAVFVFRWVWVQMKDIGFHVKFGSWKQAWLTFRNSLVITFNFGFEQVSVSGINFLVTRYLSLALLPVYTTIRTITNTAIQMTSIITNPLQPELIRYQGEKAGQKIKSVIKTYWVINGFLVNLALLLILPFIEWLYNIWTQQLLTFDKWLFCFLSLSVSVYNYGRPLVVYLYGINDLKSITWMSVSKCIVTLSVIMLFIKEYGLVVVGIAVFSAEVISSLVIPVWQTKSQIRRIHAELDWNEIVFMFLPFFILALVYMGNIWGGYNSWLVTSLGALAMLIIYIPAWNRLEPAVHARLKSLAARYVRLPRRA